MWRLRANWCTLPATSWAIRPSRKKKPGVASSARDPAAHEAPLPRRLAAISRARRAQEVWGRCQIILRITPGLLDLSGERHGRWR